MRISTSTLYSVNVTTLDDLQSKFLKTQQEITSGRRILTPADDPAGAAQALVVSQAQGANNQYSSNIGTAQTALGMSDGVLSSVSELLLQVRTNALNAGNSTLTDSDRQSMAATMQQQLNSLLTLANSTDANGNYLFSGYQGNTTPFAQSTGGVQYLGDDGQRNVQVNGSQTISTSDSGSEVFMNIKNGNGLFVTAPDSTSHSGSGNTGSGVIAQGSLTDLTQLTKDNYQVTFHVDSTTTPPATTYDVTDTTTGTQAVPPTAYTAGTNGQVISFAGMQFTISGSPDDGDQFTVKPSSNESMFTTISNLINTLNTPLVQGNAASTAQFNNSLQYAINGLNQAINNISTVRASVGARMNALTSEQTASDSLNLQYSQVLSQLQDVDYNKAVTDLTQQQTQLQAAQKTFLQISNLSVFNYL